MKQSLQLKMGQHLTMTPQLQQAIRLLQLSTLDLQQEIQEALDNNPLLEAGDELDDTPNPIHQKHPPRQNLQKQNTPAMIFPTPMAMPKAPRTLMMTSGAMIFRPNSPPTRLGMTPTKLR